MSKKYVHAREVLSKSLIMLRQALGLTQYEAADKVGVSRQYIAKLEVTTGTSVSRPYFESFCRALSTTEEWLTAGLGWVYNPRSIIGALRFVEGCLKMNPESVVMVTYENGGRTHRGIVFNCPSGTVSMSGSQTHPADSGGMVTYQEILRMIEECKLPIGHIGLTEKETKNLSKADIESLSKRASFYEELDPENDPA